MKKHEFKIHLGGIISVLGDNLYSTPEVYIRELLQNAVDAIRMREEIDEKFSPEIVLQVKEGASPQLSFFDTGIGLTEDDVHQFLATIGSSSKRKESNAAFHANKDIIGQFGIGLLSAFVVSDTITLYTRCVKKPGVVTKWVGKRDGTYTLSTVKKKMEIGTEVILKARKGMERFYEKEEIERTIVHYANFLPFPIRWANDETETINRRYTPVEVANLFSGTEVEALQKKRQSLLQYGKERFDTDFLDAFEFHTEAGGISGIAFVVPYAVKAIAERNMSTVYLKRMLISTNEEQLLPPWAFFLKTILFVDDLTPTASREGFQNNEKLQAAQAEIGDAIMEYLTRLAKNNPEGFDVIVRLHDVPFKALALSNTEFYKNFVKWLPFETSMGYMILEEYLEHSQVVQYTNNVQDFYQMSAVANAQEMWLINGGYVYDSEILEKLPSVFPQITSTVFQSMDIIGNFEDMSIEERNATNLLIIQAQKALAPFDCSVTIRQFAPHALPAMYIINEDGRDYRAFQQAQDHEAISDHMKELLAYLPQAHQSGVSNIQLCLNFHNTLIQKIATITKPELVQQVIRLLYIQSLLQAQKPLRPIETAELNVSLMHLIEQVIGKHD